jgi:2,4-dienoyl-CoA reductase-like NADH-dependent reductase (Old Yellow Enzyme family)
MIVIGGWGYSNQKPIMIMEMRGRESARRVNGCRDVSQLFAPLTIRGLTFPNRAWISPMCQYSATDGLPDDWHLVHLASRAVGGAGLVFTEATAVSPDGRISPADTGIWSAAHVAAWRPIVDAVHRHDVPIGIQLAHAGRKASTRAPWQGRGSVALEEGGWPTVAPSATPFGGDAAPRAMTTEEIAALRRDFVAATLRALDAGFDVVELHAAHGYLLHQFLSPLVNTRTDGYGGDFAGRTRLTLEVAQDVREVWPQDKPLFVRISASDWAEGGWDLEQSVQLAGLLAEQGVDLIDTSSGGAVPEQQVAAGPGYQVPFAAAIRAKTGILTGAVGLITEPEQAERVIADGEADVVLLARAALRDPYWPLHAAAVLGEDAVRGGTSWPVQYQRAVTG